MVAFIAAAYVALAPTPQRFRSPQQSIVRATARHVAERSATPRDRETQTSISTPSEVGAAKTVSEPRPRLTRRSGYRYGSDRPTGAQRPASCARRSAAERLQKVATQQRWPGSRAPSRRRSSHETRRAMSSGPRPTARRVEARIGRRRDRSEPTGSRTRTWRLAKEDRDRSDSLPVLVTCPIAAPSAPGTSSKATPAAAAIFLGRSSLSAVGERAFTARTKTGMIARIATTQKHRTANSVSGSVIPRGCWLTSVPVATAAAASAAAAIRARSISSSDQDMPLRYAGGGSRPSSSI